MRFDINLSDEYVARLCALKEEAGAHNSTFNDFAEQLLKDAIHRMHPEPVKYDDNGERIRR